MDLTIVILFMAVSFCGISYSLVAPFVPIEMEEKGVDPQVTGWIFASFSVSMILGAQIIGKVQGKIGRRNILLVGILLQATSNVAYGMSHYISGDSSLYIPYTIIVRMIEGFSSTCTWTPSYAITTIVYKENAEAMLAVVESATGFGFMIGPFVGSMLYEAGGFTLPFYVVAGIFLLSAPLIRFGLSSSVDETEVEPELAPNSTLLQ